MAVGDGALVFENDRYPPRIVPDEFYHLRSYRFENVSNKNGVFVISFWIDDVCVFKVKNTCKSPHDKYEGHH